MPAYRRLYAWIAARRLRARDLDGRVIHAHLATVLFTAVLMWGYTVLAVCTIDHPLPGVVGLVCSVIHLLSPLLFRRTARALLVCSLMLAAGMVHQATFAYFTGGYLSNIVIWFGVLPWLGGIIAGWRGAFLWCAVSLVMGMVFLDLHLVGHRFPDLISPTGRDVGQGIILFGWIILSSVMILVHVGMRERKEAELAQQKERIDDLCRALCHDLATPLGSVAMGASALRSASPAEALDGATIIDRSVVSMREILGGARLLYALDRGLAEAGTPVANLDQVVAEVATLLAGPLSDKALRLEINQASLSGTQVAGDPAVLIHHVLGNVLANAIKFSRMRSVIRVHMVADDHRGMVELVVRDQGIGMPVEIASALFSQPRTTTRVGTAGERGSGFGLQLARAFIARYGGDLHIETSEGAAGAQSGTTVRLVFIRTTADKVLQA